MRNIKLLFSAFVFFYVMFFEWGSLDSTLVGWIHNGLVLLFPIVNYRIFGCLVLRKYKWINILAICWGIVVLYSAYVNQALSFDKEYWNVLTQSFDSTSLRAMRYDHAYYYVLKVVMFILYFEYLNIYGHGLKFLFYVCCFMCPYVLLSDINGFVYQSDGIYGYEVGNKFYVCYLNILLIAIYMLIWPILNGKRKLFIKVLLLITFLLSVKTKCSTMVIGTVVYYFFLFSVGKGIRNLLYKRWFYILGLFVCDILFLVLVVWILQFPLVQYFIVDVLGEDLTLTGRIEIYSRVGEVLNECPLYGFGIGNAYLTTTMYGIGDNAQNGLLNLFIEIGLIGTILYVSLLLGLIRKVAKLKKSYSIICFIYLMLILSSIEVTFTTYFTGIMILLLLNVDTAIANNKKQIYLVSNHL